MSEAGANAEDGKWAAIEMAITRQFDRCRKSQRNWTIGLIVIIVMFVLFFLSSFASAATNEHAGSFASLISVLSEKGASWVLGLAPIGLVGFQAMKKIGQCERKIEQLEMSLLCIKQHDADWKKYWHRANYSDEGEGAVMGFLESMT
ncbi:MAG TPA: hypothetical protein VG735_13770 [Caulobacterales bacterium]|jgi:hypothetical protein|nr:hypothetical protein [Caulobacterales bacterium]